MAMNTTVNTGNVPQIERSNPTTKSDAKIISKDASASFQPETQVELQNSIRSMLSALEKTTMSKGPADGLPEEVRRMVDTMLRNAFSLDASLGQGISDVLQNQKFTLEQLGVLSKFLEQLSALAGENAIKDLPESLKALLANLDLLDGEGGKLLDSVALQKLAFQLLEGKKFDELPAALQFLLLQSVTAPQTGTPQQQEGMQFLKQLVQYFMPRPAAGESTSQAPNQGTPQNPANQAGTGGGGQTQGAQNAPHQTQNAPGGQAQNAPQSGTGQQGAAAGAQQPGGAPQSAQNQQGQSGPAQQLNQGNAPAGTQAQANQSPPGTQQSGQQSALPNQQSGASAQSPNQSPATPGRGQAAASTPQNAPGGGESTVAQNAAQARPALQNTPQTMQLMKQMAGQLLQKEQINAADAALLRNFINGGKPMLEAQDVKQLQQLIRMSEENMPPTIRLAAQQQNLPDLPKLWAFVQLANLTRLLNLSSERLRNSSKNVNDFAAILKKSMQNENEVSGGQRSMSFMTPLYMGDHEKCYPTYVHIYNDGGDGDKDGDERKETWLRLCLLTENIGAVELVFRLYEKQNVNLRIAFSAPEAAENFYDYIPDLEKSFEDLPLVLTDVKVSAIGE